VFKLLSKRRVPIVTVQLAGGYEYYPRYTRRVKRHSLRLEYRVYPAGSRQGQRLVQGMVRRERRRDAELRRKGCAQWARGAEQLVYVCPRCATPFRCLGQRNGTIRCRACGERFTLLKGKGLAIPGQGTLSLPELEKRCLRWTESFKARGQAIPGQLLLRSSTKNGLDLQSDHRLRRLDGLDARPGRLLLEPEGVVAQFADGRRKKIRHEELCSVLVEGNRKLELSYRTEGKEGGYLFFLPPQRYAVFLQHFLRRQAFGSPYSRYRGSRRVDVEEL
jgi:DNA-directed RNA polymerase subunit RPC12/RpoP